ncbi:MAG: hypothetical protein HC884_08970 [Chloroflexaceae bacterium]|nr:hypothetical protein [Chloroflexaceae bacterium]
MSDRQHTPTTPTLVTIMSTGYAALNRRLWVLVIPVAMNMVIGWGSRLSFAPFFSLHYDQVSSLAALTSRDPDHQKELIAYLQNADMRRLLAGYRFIPTLPDAVLYRGGLWSGQTTLVWSLGGALISAVSINLLTLLASSFFLTALTSAVTADPGTSPSPGIPIPSVWETLVVAVRLASYLLLLAMGVLAAGLPSLILSILMVREFPLLATPLFLGWFVLWFWFSVFTGFGIEAMLVSRVGPVQAVLRSVRLVRHHLLGALGLVVLSMLITSGLGVIWSALAQHPAGLAVAMGGSAYIGSGLVAARLVFYRERWGRMR